MTERVIGSQSQAWDVFIQSILGVYAMKDEVIIEHMRSVALKAPATGVAGALAATAPDGLTQGTLISYFKRAFPQIPLRALLEAGAWTRVSDGGLTDEELDILLGPWIPTEAG